MDDNKNKLNIVNVTPSPQILTAITHNPLSPIDALCELIDNSIDAFINAERSGVIIQNPQIDIILPSKVDVRDGIGKLSISDNGLGLTLEQAKSAVTAGYSGNKNPLDNLGLFGLGFNISTGKLGIKTIFTTARKEDEKALSIEIDLVEMKRSGAFNVPIEFKPKIFKDFSGTIIEISDWWKNGDLNNGFINKLIQIGKPKLCEKIGRIYSTILKKGIKIFINGEECLPFNHCVWLEKRFVQHQKLGKIPAKINFNKVVGHVTVCSDCWHILEDSDVKCSICGSTNKRTNENRVKGWVGIQRFDDLNNYGVDLIRNGRCIRVFEKEAFFTWVTAAGDTVLDYPIDNSYGRIVGEVHIDAVPVDYLKSDFSRTSLEWHDAIKFLRGESCLQPQRAAELHEPENHSPIYQLFQGYRKVRTPGTKDMYMGYWDEVKNGPTRCSRNTEQELYAKFLKNESGYGPNNDEEWWKHVEAAERRPLNGVKECPIDGTQVPESFERCSTCNYIFNPKQCINCKEDIAPSESICPSCGSSQVKIEDEWKCNICHKKNPPYAKNCLYCKSPIGSENVLDFKSLIEKSDLQGELTNNHLTIPLPNDQSMQSINLHVYQLKPFYEVKVGKVKMPVVTIVNDEGMHIFIDYKHEAINAFQDRAEDYISMEIAYWILQNYNAQITEANRHLWSIGNLYFTIQENIWRDRIELSQQDTVRNIKEFFQNLSDFLVNNFQDLSQEIFDEFSDRDKGIIISSMTSNNINNDFDEKIQSGAYFPYIPEELLLSIFEKYPDKFFDNNFWRAAYNSIPISDAIVLEDTKKGIVKHYKVCLEDMINYLKYKNPETNYTQKVNQTLKIINYGLVV